MSIDSEKAAEIAHRFGLSVSDAAGLARLASDEMEAERIARRFAAPAPQESTAANASINSAIRRRARPSAVPEGGNINEAIRKAGGREPAGGES